MARVPGVWNQGSGNARHIERCSLHCFEYDFKDILYPDAASCWRLQIGKWVFPVVPLAHEVARVEKPHLKGLHTGP